MISMSLQTATGSPIRVIGADVWLPWKGAWVVDATLDALTPSVVPTSGKATLVIGGVTMSGTVDSRASGTFHSKASVRVVGGGGAWDKTVPRQDFSNDGGVLSTTVYSQTASLIGEVVTDLAPTMLGLQKYERSEGPASRVFGASDWWVDVTGTTFVGPRAPAVADPSLVLRDFDTTAQRLSFTCDTLLIPNTTLVDTRFNGATPIVRDVTQHFDASGSHGTALCSAQAVSRPLAALQAAVVEFSGRTWSRTYRYRFIQLVGDRWGLQAVNPGDGQPDLIPLQPTSLLGITLKPAASQEMIVGFEAGDPSKPYVVSYSLQGLPLQTTIDASLLVSLGASAAQVQIAGGSYTLVPTPWATGVVAALSAMAATFEGFGTPPTNPLAPLAAVGSTLAGALTSLPSPATTKTTAT